MLILIKIGMERLNYRLLTYCVNILPGDLLYN